MPLGAHFYQSIFENTPDGMFVVRSNGEICLVNSQVSHLFGYAKEELLSRPIEILLPERLAAHHETHRTDYLNEPRTRTMGKGLNLFAKRKDGSEFPVDIMLSPIHFEGEVFVLCAVRDITEKHKAELKFRALLESAPDAMVIVNEDGFIVLANTQAQKMFGYTKEELLGQLIELLVPNRSRENHPQHREMFFNEPQTRPMGSGIELNGRCKDGQEIPIEISLSPISTDEGLLVAAAVRDISDRRKAKEQIMGNLREKEVLLKEVHHRVKNNLAVISSMFYLQSTYTQDSVLLDMLLESQNRVRSMALVHESIYRSDDLAAVNFATYIQRLSKELMVSLNPQNSPVNLKLNTEDVHLRIDSAVPCGLVLNELMTNALKHGFPSGKKGQVTVDLSIEGETVLLKVTDDGVGADHEMLTHGSSLGLRIIRSLSKQLDGNFEIQSGTSGTQATLEFPLPGSS